MSTMAHGSANRGYYDLRGIDRAAVRIGLALARWGRRRARRGSALGGVERHPVTLAGAAELDSRRNWILR